MFRSCFGCMGCLTRCFHNVILSLTKQHSGTWDSLWKKFWTLVLPTALNAVCKSPLLPWNNQWEGLKAYQSLLSNFSGSGRSFVTIMAEKKLPAMKKTVHSWTYITKTPKNNLTVEETHAGKTIYTDPDLVHGSLLSRECLGGRVQLTQVFSLLSSQSYRLQLQRVATYTSIT